MSLLPTALGFLFVVASLYFYQRYKNYKLVLSKNTLVEHFREVQNTFSLTNVEELDCELNTGWWNISFYPVLHLVLIDGTKIRLKLKEEASLVELAKWITLYFPSCKISKNVVKVLQQIKHSMSNPFLFRDNLWRNNE